MAFEIRPLTGETWNALAALFQEGGDPRWCWSDGGGGGSERP